MSEQNLDEWLGAVDQNSDYLDEETLIHAISQRVTVLLADQPDLLFSHLYRLDVREDKIQAALAMGGDVARSLAILIVDRQKERISTKKKYKSSTTQDPDTGFTPEDF